MAYDYCPSCSTPVRTVPRHDPGPDEVEPSKSPPRAGHWRLGLLWVLMVAPVLSMALHPSFRAMVLATAGPLVLVPVLFAVVFLYAVRAQANELLALLRRRHVRVAHGLEHATLRVLEERGFEIYGGRTEGERFEIVVSDEVRLRDVRSAFRAAVRRIRKGETTLAYDRRCGTSVLAGAFVASLVALVAGAAGLFTTLPLSVVVGMLVVFAIVLVPGIAPLGLLAQWTMTVSTRFAKAGLSRVAHRGAEDETRRYELFVWIV